MTSQPSFSLLFFFKQKTAYEMRISDWSSDVCSSDLRHRLFHHFRLDAPPRGAGTADRAHIGADAQTRHGKAAWPALGVHAVHMRDVRSFEEMVAKSKRMALRHKVAQAGDRKHVV